MFNATVINQQLVLKLLAQQYITLNKIEAEALQYTGIY
jgi:hypothetical protein